jgi:hypothetical protein
MALGAFKAITTHRLAVLLLVFVFGNSFLMLPADPTSTCAGLVVAVAVAQE